MWNALGKILLANNYYSPARSVVSLSFISEESFFQVGTVDPVGDFRAIINQKDEDRFDEGRLAVKIGCL